MNGRDWAREYPNRPVVGVGAVIVVWPDDELRAKFSEAVPRPLGVVLIKRRFEPLAGEWSLPGGTVEVGETLESAIAREVVEETGLSVQVGPVIEVFDRIMRDDTERVQYHFVLIDYLCIPTGGRLKHGSDTTDAIVADPGDLDRYQLTDKARSVITAALTLAHRAVNAEPEPRTTEP